MLRRYAPIAPSSGTRIDPRVRIEVLQRDDGCVGRQLGWPGDCQGALEIDHVRASGGLGMKSRSTADNLVSLCGAHHRLKTNEGRKYRPALLEYLAAGADPHEACVDPCSSLCPAGIQRDPRPDDIIRGAA